MFTGSMRRSFKDSLKVLEADIQHANTLAEFVAENEAQMVPRIPGLISFKALVVK